MKIDKFLVFIILLSCLLMFPNLGNRYLDGDESITAMLGQSIQQNGLPYAYNDNQTIHQYDSNNVIYPPVKDARLTEENLWREQPWLYFYTEALSFSLFGVNEFSARLPYAIIGILAVIFLYFFSKKITNNEKISKLSIFLMATSITFYLFSRKARYFSMIMLLVMTTVYTYINLIDSRGKKSISNILLFILSSALLFHTNYGVFFGIIAGLMIHFLIFKEYKTSLKEIIMSLCGIFILTFPWYYLTDSFAFNSSEVSFSYSYLLYIATGLVYLLIMFGFSYFFIPFIPQLLKEKDKLVKRNYTVLFTVILSFICIISIHNEIPPTRYLVAFLPIICLLNSAILVKAFDKKRAIAVILIGLMIFTNILLVFPFNFLKDTSIAQNIFGDYEKSDVSEAVTHMLSIRFPFTSYLYEITHDYDNSDEVLITYLLKNSQSGDTYFASVAGISKTIMFYTNLNYITNITSDASSDWIIPYNFTERASPRGKEKEKTFSDFVSLNYDLGKYEKIVLNASNIRFSEMPDSIYHKFRTTKEGIIEIYRLKK